MALGQLREEMVADFLTGLRSEPKSGGAMEAVYGAVRAAEQRAASAVEHGTQALLGPLVEALESQHLVSEAEADTYVGRVSETAVRAFAHLQDWAAEADAAKSLFDEALAGPFQVAQHLTQRFRNNLQAEVGARLTQALRANGRYLNFLFPSVPQEDRVSWGVRVAAEYAELFNVDKTRGEQAAALERFSRDVAVPICVVEEEIAHIPDALPEPVKAAERTVAFLVRGFQKRMERLHPGIEVHAAASEAQVLRHYTQRFSHLRRESWQEIIHSSPALIFLQKACDDHKNGVWAAGGDPLEGLASPLEDQEIEDVAGDYNHAEPEPEDDGQTA
jgi:hypothetical protein